MKKILEECLELLVSSEIFTQYFVNFIIFVAAPRGIEPLFPP